MENQEIVTLEDLSFDGNLLNQNIEFNALQNLNILITGSRGMLGGGLVATLRSLISIGILDCNLFLASRKWNAPGIENNTKKILHISNEDARKKNYPFDLIIHCASPSNITRIQTIEELEDVNLVYLEDCISQSTQKVIYISSGEVYQGRETKISTKLALPCLDERRNWYPYVKLKTENSLHEMSQKKNFSLDVVRLFHTFGPGMRKDDGRSFADIVFGAGVLGKIVLKSPGDQVRAFLYLTDAIRAILMCATTLSSSRVFNIGSSKPTTILQFAQMASDISGSKIEFHDVSFEHSPFDVIVPDLSETIALGWSQEVDLVDGLIRTLNWVRRQTFN